MALTPEQLQAAADAFTNDQPDAVLVAVGLVERLNADAASRHQQVTVHIAEEDGCARLAVRVHGSVFEYGCAAQELKAFGAAHVAAGIHGRA